MLSCYFSLVLSNILLFAYLDTMKLQFCKTACVVVWVLPKSDREQGQHSSMAISHTCLMLLRRLVDETYK